jgi:hypothetical protein
MEMRCDQASLDPQKVGRCTAPTKGCSCTLLITIAPGFLGVWSWHRLSKVFLSERYGSLQVTYYESRDAKQLFHHVEQG